MPRPPRIDAPGLVHHVIARGVAKRTIFLDDRDRRDFLERLERVLIECAVDCFAWALMPNHYHLLLRTPLGGLGHAMARINTGHAVRFNLRYDRVGHLFQNRFRSLIVPDDAYFLTLIRYIHRNPLRAGIVGSMAELERHPWTGHAVLMGRGSAPFQSVRDVLGLLGDRPASSRERLRSWMSDDLPEECRDAEREFAAWHDGVMRSSPARRGVAQPGTDEAEVLRRTVDEVCRRYRLEPGELQSRRRTRSLSAARAAIAWLACDRGVRGVTVAGALGCDKSSVTRARLRGRRVVGNWADA